MAPAAFILKPRTQSSPRHFLAAAFLSAVAFAPGVLHATPTLDAGMSHSLAVTSSGTVAAWGDNSFGALGNGTRAHSSMPVRSGTLSGVVAVSAGRDLSVALRSDGTVWTWGTGPGLGTQPRDNCGGSPCALSPQQVPGLSGVTAIAASGGGGFVLALLSNGTVMAWGSNQYGQLGIGSTTDQATPMAIPAFTGVTAIAAGDSHGVALKSDRKVWAWGSNAHGELSARFFVISAANTCQAGDVYVLSVGPPSVRCSKSPLQVNIDFLAQLAGAPVVTAISAKGRHTLALKSDGTVWAWGSNIYGQIGNGGTVDSGPIQVPGLTGIRAISAGFSHSLAVGSVGFYWAWGLNMSGQLANGLVPPSSTCTPRPATLNSSYILGRNWPCVTSPTRFGGTRLNSVRDIVGGGAHTLAVLTGLAIPVIDGFGLNDFGQLGTTPQTGFAGSVCYADPGRCRGDPQGSAGSGISIGRPSTSGAINVNTVEDGLVFDPQPIGIASAAQEVRVTNLGGPMTLTGIAATGDFSYTTDCPVKTPIATQASCGVFVTFKPTAPGTRTGRLVVSSDLANAPTAELALRGSMSGTAIDLTLTRGGTGTGSVTSSPSGLNCGSTCVAYFASGASVALTAAPSAGSTFAGWGGSCSGSAASCGIVMSAAKAVTATFNAVPLSFALNVTLGGTGTGSVTSSPAGINCGATCTATFNGGTAVTLTPTPTSGSTFTGWSGGGCAGTGNCTVTINATTNISATFTAAPAVPGTFALTVARDGAGTGTLTSSPAGINCGTTCTANFNSGAVVTLTPVPTSGSSFAGWAGACSGSTGCTVTMSAAKSVTATFNAQAAGTAANYTALWWSNPTEQGWGINLVHQGDVLFGTLFTYDATGTPMWLVMSGGRKQPDGITFTGELYRTTGPVFNASPWGTTIATQVGMMSVRFTSVDSATLTYNVNTISVTKTLRRQVFDTRAANCMGSTASRTGLTNYQDLWWIAAESGWGINVTHQGNTIFATLFTYNASGQGMWLVLGAGRKQPDGSFFGELYQTRGPAFNASPWVDAIATQVGTMRLSFTNGMNGTLVYTVNGVQVTKTITRQVFANPVPACS